MALAAKQALQFKSSFQILFSIKIQFFENGTVLDNLQFKIKSYMIWNDYNFRSFYYFDIQQ